jgi:hypothetical protein
VTELSAKVQPGIDGYGYASHGEILVTVDDESLDPAAHEALAGVLGRVALSLAGPLRDAGNRHCSGLRCGVEGFDVLPLTDEPPLLAVTVPTRDERLWVARVEAALAEATP